MRALILLFSMLVAMGCASQPAHSKQAAKKYTVEEFLKTDNYRGGSFSPNENKILVTTNKEGHHHPYAIDIENGMMERMAPDFTNPISYAVYFPHDERILFSADNNGDERYHIYCCNTDGKIVDLTEGMTGRADFGGWNEEKDGFFYLSNERDPTVFDAYEMDLATFTPKMVFQNEGRWVTHAISPDKKYIALTKLNAIYDSDIYLYNLETKEIAKITPHTGKISFDPIRFEKDSSCLYYLTDEESEYSYVKRYVLATGAHEMVFKADGEVDLYGLSESGNYVLRVVGHGAHSEFSVYNREKGTVMDLPQMEAGVVRYVKFSPSEEKICMAVSTYSTPTDLFVMDLKTHEVKQLTYSLNPSIDKNDLVPGQEVAFTSFDGLQIPAILYQPKTSTKAPALVYVHGGPSAHSTLGYEGRIQYLVNQGYAILDVNYRGSTGYGKTYLSLADKKHGDVDLKDCIYGKKFLQSLDFVDKEHIGIMGGSYGGYMVLAALAFTPDEFACGVDNCGVSNWVRTMQEFPPWWNIGIEWLHQKIGHPEQDSDYLMQISPLFHAENITKPLLVFQGVNDPRVIKAESDEIVEKVQKNGIPCSYILFEDEGHSLTKKSNSAQMLEETSKFLDLHLKPSVKISTHWILNPSNKNT